MHTPGTLRRGLADDDLDALMLVPGVGKRTAQRLLVELKARLELPDLDLAEATGGRPTPRGEVRDALVGLGYSRRGGARRARPARRRGHGRGPPARRAPGAGRVAMRPAGGGPVRRVRSGVREELLSPTADPAEAAEETTLRPRRLDEFVGQPRLREHLEIMLTASRRRGQAVDHVLFAGPPGLGKTTLAGIIATEMGARMQPTSGPALERAGDLAAILTNLDDGGVLFIDEIHGLPRAVEEVLYPAMEDFQLDIVIGKGPSARTIRLDLPRFTLVGATTRTGLITGPLRDRFGFVARLDYYDVDELTTILSRAAQILGVELDPEGASEIASQEPGHAAHREPLAEARPRLRGGARRRPRHARHGAATRSRCSRSTSSASTRSTVRSSARCAARSRGGPWASARSRSRSARRRRPSRTCTSRSCSSAGCSSARPAGRMATPSAFEHLGLHVRRHRARLRTCSDHRVEIRGFGHGRRTGPGTRCAIASRSITIANGKANALSPDVIAQLDAAVDARRGRRRGDSRRAR